MTATESNAAPGVPSGLDLPEGRITPEALDDLRRITGLQMRPERYIREATIDTLNNFCNGIGDLNPLHRDEEYAKWTRYGGLLAPGCFLYARTWPGRTRFGLPGVHGFHAGNDFRFEREIRIGDRIDSVERMLGFEEKESRFSGKLVIIHVETTFTNQRGELIATVRGWNTRHERAAARERGKESSEESVTAGGRAYDYAPEELYEIEQAQYSEDERIRGGDTRYWEDVKVGDQLDAIARGPLTTSDVTAWLVGTGRGRAHGAALKEARRHPGHYFRNPDAGQGLEYTGMGHQLARGRGAGRRPRRLRLRPAAHLLGGHADRELDGRRRLPEAPARRAARLQPDGRHHLAARHGDPHLPRGRRTPRRHRDPRREPARPPHPPRPRHRAPALEARAGGVVEGSTPISRAPPWPRKSTAGSSTSPISS